MKAIALIALLIGTVSTLNAQETMWEGTHRIVSSTDGNRSFNPRKCKTYCHLTENGGQLTGSITLFGKDVPETEFEKGTNMVELRGTIDGQVIEWKSVRSFENKDKETHHCETTFRGVRDGDTITGYFEQTWDQKGMKGTAPVTYRGIVDLKKKKKE